MALGGLVLGSFILYLKGMWIMMFQLSGFYYKRKLAPQPLNPKPPPLNLIESPKAHRLCGLAQALHRDGAHEAQVRRNRLAFQRSLRFMV